MIAASVEKRELVFKTAAGTSRGVLMQKPSWFIRLWITENPCVVGWGECSVIPGLSYDDVAGLEARIAAVVEAINSTGVVDMDALYEWPSIRFGLDTALRDLANNGVRCVFPSSFLEGHKGISINGLIWMGDMASMSSQIEKKLTEGYTCLKMKIGAIGFDDEMRLLTGIRERFSSNVLELRVDANGAFGAGDVFDKLERLQKLDLHSIEQPVMAGQWELMQSVCRHSSVPVALDEELIGVFEGSKRRDLLDFIRPQYIILKPGLLGGFDVCEKWINLAQDFGIGWWATSALEGNIGLNAIAQWTFTKRNSLPQGLGTGQLFENNIVSPLKIEGGQLFYDPSIQWGV